MSKAKVTKESLLREISYLDKELSNKYVSKERVQVIKSLSIEIAKKIDDIYNTTELLSTYVNDAYSKKESRYDRKIVRRILKVLSEYLSELW